MVKGWSSLAKTFSRVGLRPSLLMRLSTWRTWSGRAMAFCRRFFLASSTTMRSVPADTRLLVVRTSTPPALQLVVGTSASHNSPVR